MRGKRFLAICIITGFTLLGLSRMMGKEVVDYKNKYENEPNLLIDIGGLGRENTYGNYLEKHLNSQEAKTELVVLARSYSKGEGVKILDNIEGISDVLLCDEASYVAWEIQVPESGLYAISLDYYAVSSRGADIERKFYINGEIPFTGADNLAFSRTWINKSEVKQDNQGNDIRPAQTDKPMWMEAYLKDDLGYYVNPYVFYFEKGANTIALEAINEPMVLHQITLNPIKEKSNYAAYLEGMTQQYGDDIENNHILTIQGEEAVRKSSPSLYAIYDRSAPNTEPYSVQKISLNMIGGQAWRVPGQWIEWEVEIPEDGYYHLSIKSRQNYSRGFVSNRTLRIDGEIPFAEMAAIPFRYSNDWEMTTLSDARDEPYKFYLTKGTHQLRLEVTLGELGTILNQLEDSVFRLNSIYRKILVLTGTLPDEFRDYRIEQVYPEVIEGMQLESKRLYKFIDDVVAYSGQKASQVAAAQTLAEQLEYFVENPEKIPKSFGNFKDNISALGTSIMTLSEAPLDIDSLMITGEKASIPFKKANLLNKGIHETRSFIASFTEDYNAVGDVHEDEDALQVWILTGRDQSTILKSMIDDSFTPENDIKVNLKLVDGAILLNAIIAGEGPDVVISAGQGEPVNYALRGAVEDLTVFADYEQVLGSFYPSAYEPFWFDDGLYALPETQNFNVLFYRKDILDELGISIPNTWDELITILPAIQQENMGVAIPNTERLINNSSVPDLSAFFALVYQNGGQIYDDEGMSAVINNESGVKAFEAFTRLFTHYSLPTVYDFPNRFRSGEMPIGIQDYSVYNVLVVFAPEIRGLWDFTLIPGTMQEDGTIDRSSHSSGTCTYMLKQEDTRLKEHAWTFMKWWTGQAAQARFGQEMESVMGASARYATANKEAFEQLSWSRSQMAILSEQRSWSTGLREIAGGYYTQRHITNAIRRVMNNNEDSREVLLDYVTTINEEIEKSVSNLV
jgi:ABC-type glycerol-3-phosphate transport system substrate-binding protein